MDRQCVVDGPSVASTDCGPRGGELASCGTVRGRRCDGDPLARSTPQHGRPCRQGAWRRHAVAADRGEPGRDPDASRRASRTDEGWDTQGDHRHTSRRHRGDQVGGLERAQQVHLPLSEGELESVDAGHAPGLVSLRVTPSHRRIGEPHRLQRRRSVVSKDAGPDDSGGLRIRMVEGSRPRARCPVGGLRLDGRLRLDLTAGSTGTGRRPCSAGDRRAPAEDAETAIGGLRSKPEAATCCEPSKPF